MAGPLPSVKEPHLAGRWYPVAPAELAQSVRELLAAGGSPRPGVVAVEPGDAAALAAALRSLLEPGTLLVASSDLTHYGRRFDYLPVPPTDAATVAATVRRLDEGALEHIVARDADGFVAYVERTGATIR